MNVQKLFTFTHKSPVMTCALFITSNNWMDEEKKKKISHPTCQNKMAPSEPPLQNRPSWTGCQATLLDSFLCPRKTCTSTFKFLMSNSFRRWSRLAVTNQLPLLFHFTSITVLLWAWLEIKKKLNMIRTCSFTHRFLYDLLVCRQGLIQIHQGCGKPLESAPMCDIGNKTYIVAKEVPDLGSHSLTGCWLSLLPEMMRPLWGCQWTHLTSAPCPENPHGWLEWQGKRSQIFLSQFNHWM